MAKALSISSQVRAKIAKRKAAKARIETLVSVAKWSGIAFLCIATLFAVGAIAACVGSYYSMFGF